MSKIENMIDRESGNRPPYQIGMYKLLEMPSADDLSRESTKIVSPNKATPDYKCFAATEQLPPYSGLMLDRKDSEALKSFPDLVMHLKICSFDRLRLAALLHEGRLVTTNNREVTLPRLN